MKELKIKEIDINKTAIKARNLLSPISYTETLLILKLNEIIKVINTIRK
jgi:hypothetical protein